MPLLPHRSAISHCEVGVIEWGRVGQRSGNGNDVLELTNYDRCVQSQLCRLKCHHVVTSAARIPRTSGLKEILHVAFHDAEPAAGFEAPAKIVFMKPAQAQAIWRFVRRHQDEIGSIVCHCEQGMSRSPAVALALAEALGGNTDHIRASYQPNQYVYGLMRKAIQRQTTPE